MALTKRLFCLCAYLCTIGLSPVAHGFQPYVDVPFLQPEAQRFTFPDVQVAQWPQVPFNEQIVQLTVGLTEAEALVLTNTQLWSAQLSSDAASFVRADTQLGIQVQPGFRVRRAAAPGAALSIAGPDGVYSCGTAQTVKAVGACKFLAAKIGNVNDVFQTAAGDLWIGTDQGLFYLANGSGDVTVISAVPGPVATVAFDETTQTVVAGGLNMYRRLPDGMSWYMFETPGIIDDSPTALTFDSAGTLWIANDVCVNQHYLANFTFNRVGGYQGLPMANLTSACTAPSGAVWIGSVGQGATRYLAGEWKYFLGPRWFPTTDTKHNNTVSSIVVIDVLGTETALLATDGGLSIIRYNTWTLEAKADYMQSLIYPAHERFGLICDADFTAFADMRTAQQFSSDNDGLWTSIYVATQSFRYAVTKDPAVKQLAWKAFEAMEFLNNVTGIPGLMARSVLPVGQKIPDGKWYNSTAYPGWQWKGDTSSDEVVGHMWAYPLIYDLVAETPEEKGRAARLLNNTLTYIVNNGFFLIDADGNRTTWGVWAPSFLNVMPFWYDERGVNAMQITFWLLSGYRITGNPLFINAFDTLVNDHYYGLNMVNQKITQPSDWNYSDDELAFLPYYTYIHAARPELRDLFTFSITRAWQCARSERAAPWNFIYGATGAEEFDLDNSVWTLKTYPIDTIDYPFDNGARLDVQFNRDLSRENSQQLLTLLPYDEIFMGRWNGSPFDVSGGDGMSASDGCAFLMPYWMARYHGFIVSP